MLSSSTTLLCLNRSKVGPARGLSGGGGVERGGVVVVDAVCAFHKSKLRKDTTHLL